MTSVDYVLSKFGGLSELARAIEKPVTTVSSWKSRGGIPAKYWPAIIKAAEERGQKLSADDFLKEHAPETAGLAPASDRASLAG